MTAEEYRDQLEEQELYELLGEEKMEELRQQHVERLLEEYEEHLNEQSDEELLGDEALEKLRQETIDQMVEGYEVEEEDDEIDH
jgi:hypothetical protein